MTPEAKQYRAAAEEERSNCSAEEGRLCPGVTGAVGLLEVLQARQSPAGRGAV